MKKSCNYLSGRTHSKQINMAEHVCLITVQVQRLTIANDDRVKDVTPNTV